MNQPQLIAAKHTLPRQKQHPERVFPYLSNKAFLQVSSAFIHFLNFYPPDIHKIQHFLLQMRNLKK